MSIEPTFMHSMQNGVMVRGGKPVPRRSGSVVPNLSERIAWYQDRLRPEDSAHGNGIADWTITSEYRDNFEVDGAPVWGCMCSPSLLPSIQKITADDIAAKRAHIIVRTPKHPEDLPEIERTILHELGHVLVAPMQSTNREAEENAMHSFDHFFSRLSPEQGEILARSFQNPMARAYRAPAKETAMPDPVDDKDKKEPDKGGEKPAMQEGAPRDIATIEQELLAARLANDTAKMTALQDEWFAAKMASSAAPAPVVAPPPEMGMKPEEAYQRKVNTEAVNAFVDALEVPDDKKAYLRKQPTIAAAKEALAFLPKQSATMGFDGHPSLRAKDGDDEPASVFYPSGNKTTMAACRVMARRKDGISARGIHKCTPQEQRETGQLMRFSLTDAYPMLREVAEANAQRDRKAALSSIGGDK
jgi:hypothetical protein